MLDDVLQRMKAAKIADDPFDLSVAIVNEFQLVALHLHDERPRRELREDERRRVLRRPSKRATASTTRARWRSSSASTNIPARLVEGFLPGTLDNADRRRADVQPARPRLGRGLLPGLSAGSCSTRPAAARPDRPLPSGKPVRESPRRAGPDRSAPSRPTPGRQRSPVARRPGAAGVSGAGSGGVEPGGLIVIAVVLLAPSVARRLPRLAARAARRVDARGRVRLGRRPRPAVRLRPATDPDRVRVRDGARRRPARRPAGAPDGRDREGRGRVRPARSLGDDRLQALRASYRRLRVGLLRLAFRRARAAAGAARRWHAAAPWR